MLEGRLLDTWSVQNEPEILDFPFKLGLHSLDVRLNVGCPFVDTDL